MPTCPFLDRMSQKLQSSGVRGDLKPAAANEVVVWVLRQPVEVPVPGVFELDYGPLVFVDLILQCQDGVKVCLPVHLPTASGVILCLDVLRAHVDGDVGSRFAPGTSVQVMWLGVYQNAIPKVKRPFPGVEGL